jgi:hypothetical protein
MVFRIIQPKVDFKKDRLHLHGLFKTRYTLQREEREGTRI